MTRTYLAFAVILVASFTSGCGRYRYRHRIMYAVPAPVAVIAVRPVYEPPTPPPPAQPRPIVVHAPPGSVVIINPQGGRPQVVRQVPAASEAPAELEAPAAPAAPPEADEGWFDSGG